MAIRTLSRILCLTVAALFLSACTAPDSAAPANPDARIVVTVIGAIHGRHRESETYPLERLEAAIVAFEPDYMLTEIPPHRLEEAQRQFAENDRITESRVRVFPELTDTVFPLQAELGFEIVPVAGWTQEIADNRTAALDAIAADPERRDQWQAHLAARGAYARTVGTRAQDPLFIHSRAYDDAVEAAQTPYREHFDADLGPGGWTAINAAHYDLIAATLDRIAAEATPEDPARVLILFGAWHKYWFLRELERREDVRIEAAARLF